MKQPQPRSNDVIRQIALDALVAVASDEEASASARAAAARTLMESIGVIGRLQDLGRLSEERNATEMTPNEISDEIARLSHRLPPPKLRKVKTP